MLRMYDLAGADPALRFSPYCWRIRMALAHKGLDVETIPWRFSDRDLLGPSGGARVPVLVSGEEWIADSWRIANWLEDRYPDRPALFGSPEARSLCRLHSVYGDVLVGQLARFLLVDIAVRLDARDVDYFRGSREKRFGATLEDVVADRDARLPAFREGLVAMRSTLKSQPFLGGAGPMYADYAVFGAFQWARAISPFRILERDDPVAQWRERLLDAFDGLARRSPGYD